MKRQGPQPEGSPATLLMCPPSYYTVEYEINPWMKRRQPVDAAKSWLQWQTLLQTLTKELGALVELVQPVRGLPDFAFAANAGLVMDGIVIPSRFRHPERSREEQYWHAWFEAHGHALCHLPPWLCFEGEGDVLPCGDLLVAGFGFRSDAEAVRRAGELLEKETLALELASPWFYHLDTCFCPLNTETVLYYPRGFTAVGEHAIKKHFPDAIPVPEEEAYRFVCNSIVIGRHVVMSGDCPMTRAALLSRGYLVHEVDVSEFLKAGGGAKCLALFLGRGVEGSHPAERSRWASVSAR